MFETKDQNKNSEELSEEEVGSIPGKEFKIMITKMTKEFGRRMDDTKLICRNRLHFYTLTTNY